MSLGNCYKCKSFAFITKCHECSNFQCCSCAYECRECLNEICDECCNSNSKIIDSCITHIVGGRMKKSYFAKSILLLRYTPIKCFQK